VKEGDILVDVRHWQKSSVGVMEDPWCTHNCPFTCYFCFPTNIQSAAKNSEQVTQKVCSQEAQDGAGRQSHKQIANMNLVYSEIWSET
jgi:hypothetical protein